MREVFALVFMRSLGHSVGSVRQEVGMVDIADGLIDAFIRDELSKGRYDPAISKICFEMLLELFGRTLKSDLGERVGGEAKIENVC